MAKKAKVVRIGGALAGVLFVGTTVAFLLRRVNRKGVNYSLPEFERSGERGWDRQVTADHFLPSLAIFEAHISSDPALVERVADCKDRIFQAYVDCDADACEQALNELFAQLCQTSPAAGISLVMSFRDDLREIAGHLGTQPLRSQYYVDRWTSWWAQGENLLPPEQMWLGLSAVQVGRTFLARYNPLGRKKLGHREYERVTRLLQSAADALTDSDAVLRLEALDRMAEYFQETGHQVA